MESGGREGCNPVRGEIISHLALHWSTQTCWCKLQRQDGMEVNQDCTIFWYQKPMLGFQMTKCSTITALEFKS